MNKSRTFIAAALVALASAWAAPADAVVITRTYVFTTLGTIPNSAIGNVPPPTSPVFGSFTVTFDNAVIALNRTTGISLNALNRPLGGTLAYSYSPALDTLTIGGRFSATNGALTVVGNTNDISLIITDADGPDPDFFSLAFSRTGTSGFVSWLTFNGVIVPEPASLALFGTALLGLGIARRRFHRA